MAKMHPHDVVARVPIRLHPIACIAVFVLVSLRGAVAADLQSSPTAETVAPAAPAPASADSVSFFDPRDGQFDVSSFLERPRGFLPVPVVITEPAIGYGGGLFGMFLRPREEAGAEGWSRPDISAAGGIATENGTRAAFAFDTSRWLDGRLKTQAGIGAGRINLDFFGLGVASSMPDEPAKYTLQFHGAVAQANWQLAPQSPWSIGLRYVYADVDPSLRETPAFPVVAENARVTVSAPTAVFEYDSRDNVFTPLKGVYAESSLLTSREALGSTDSFERFQQILIGYYPLSNRLFLGARGDYAWSSDGTPFFLRPYVTLRGVPAMRYQGDQAASVELEARWQFQGRWSLVAFGGGGKAWSDRDAFSTTRTVGSGGVGFRYEIASKFGLHVGADLAHSPGTTAIYLTIGNAWFRP
jgi:Omp85 superfamily domain